MEALKIHVERIVRPIRASVRRKNTMREELLGHLTRKVQSMLAEGATEVTACAAAVAQLGSPAVLREELQETVPRLERILYLRLPNSSIADAWFDRQSGETAAHFALYRSVYTSIPVVVVLGAILTAQVLLKGTEFAIRTRLAPVDHARIIAVMCAMHALASALAYYVADAAGLRAALARSSNSRPWRKAAALYLFAAGYLLLFLAPSLTALWAFRPESTRALWMGLSSNGGLRNLLLYGLLLLVVAFPWLGWVMSKEHEQYESWGRLPNDK